MKKHSIKHRIIIKNTLFAIVSAIIFLSAMGKFAHRDTVVSLFEPFSMNDFMIRIAYVQLIIVFCLMSKPLRSLGVLIASAFLGGMIFMMTATGNSPLSAVLTLLVLWLAYKLEWWGYWNHYSDETCGCGWCERSKHGKHREFVTTCHCKEGACKC